MRWRKSPRPRSEDGWWMVHTTVPHRRFWSCVTWQWKWGGRAPVNWDHHLSKKTSASATWTAAISFLWLYDHCHILQPSKETTEASYEDQNDEYPWTIDKNYLFIYIYIYIIYTYIYILYIHIYILYICIYRYEISLHDMSFISILYVRIYGFLWKWGPFVIYHQWWKPVKSASWDPEIPAATVSQVLHNSHDLTTSPTVKISGFRAVFVPNLWGLPGLVNVQKAIENDHLEWIYQLKIVIFHSYLNLPEGNS